MGEGDETGEEESAGDEGSLLPLPLPLPLPFREASEPVDCEKADEVPAYERKR